MTFSEPKKVHGYFQKQDSPLARILKKVRNLQDIEKHFLPFLQASQPHIANGLKVISFEQGKLTVMVASGHIATHLKLTQNSFIAELQTHPHLAAIKQLDIKTRPFHYEPSAKPAEIPAKKPNQPSTEALIILDELANRLPDGALKNILKKMTQQNNQASTSASSGFT